MGALGRLGEARDLEAQAANGRMCKRPEVKFGKVGLLSAHAGAYIYEMGFGRPVLEANFNDVGQL